MDADADVDADVEVVAEVDVDVEVDVASALVRVGETSRTSPRQLEQVSLSTAM